VTIDRFSITLHLVHDVNFFLVTEEHLGGFKNDQLASDCPEHRIQLTIIALTRVLPTCSNVPGVAANAGIAAASARRPAATRTALGMARDGGRRERSVSGLVGFGKPRPRERERAAGKEPQGARRPERSGCAVS
jgi:hypothetical protein